MKKIIFAGLCVAIFASCTKDLTGLNNDPKHPVTVPSSSLFTRAQLSFANLLDNTNVNSNIFRLIEQQWQETTYTDESNYDIGTRAIADAWWNELFAANQDFGGFPINGVLSNLNLARQFARTDVTDAGALKNDTAMIDVQEVYAWYVLVTTYGNIPYTQALQPTVYSAPKYDDAATIYLDLLKRLDADISSFDDASGSYGSADLIYGGDITKWKKFANSLKVKMGILLADSDLTTATTAITSAVTSGIFESNDDNALVTYPGSTPNASPVWVDLVLSGRLDFVANSTILSYMTPNDDPRLPYYFTKDASGGYSGGDPGAGSSFPLLSQPSGLKRILKGDASDIGNVASTTFPADLLDYSEISFYLAEAAARGITLPQTAEQYYDQAITSSIEYWTGSTAGATAYLLLPTVSYSSTLSGTTYKQKIGTQAYIAFYNKGYDAWTETRRLDYPVLPAPAIAQSGFPVRYTYPVKEQNINQPNYEAASAAIGGDAVETKLWFDKF